MCDISYTDKSGIQSRKQTLQLRKELFRKLIHMGSLAVPLLLHRFYFATVCGLVLVLCVYVISEILRLRGRYVPLISTITAIAARNRDGDGFVCGPVTLTLGILAAALLFNETAATIGICALALGDGVASLAGKLWGQIIIPNTNGKSAEGSLACFLFVYVSSVVIVHDAFSSFWLACLATAVEMIPLKNWDNILIPVLVAAAAQYVFFI